MSSIPAFSPAQAPALEVRDVSKAYAGVPALRHVSLSVLPGEVHALLGENGAGKSTLIKTIAGVIAPDQGEVHIGGQALKLGSYREARRLGVAIVHQELMLFPELSVAENVFFGHAPRRGGALDWAAMRRRSRELLDMLDSGDLDVGRPVGELSLANRQRVEIAKALSHDARVLIMDEPTAALTDADAGRLMAVIERLRDRGVAIVYVSHRMPEIFALADRVTVIRDGSHVGTHRLADVDEAQLIAMMVGRPLDRMFPPHAAQLGPTVLELRKLGCGSEVRDISLQLRAGEIVGMAGLIGSGRTELARAVFGITPATSGEILLDGKAVKIRGPKQARDLGIAYIPEDRGLQGLVKAMTIGENTSMAILDRIARRGVIRLGEEFSRAQAAIASLGIKAQGPAQRVGELSGGNQQKVVLAKWLAIAPRVLILDEPTRGIDVGAKAEIYALMARLAQKGMAILMISSDLPEVLGMSDRVLVMRGGTIVRSFDRAQASPEAVGAAMTGTLATEGSH